MNPIWRIDMLGVFEAKRGEQAISWFRTRRVGMLLAYLSFYPNRSHDRAFIGEMLWPEGDPNRVAGNLRQAIATLRRQVEPPPLPFGSVINAHRSTLSVRSAEIETDVADFERELADARGLEEPSERRETLERAVALYGGELLPGYDEEWVLHERMRLEDLFANALSDLARLNASEGRTGGALDALHRALNKSPYDERIHADLMRLYLQEGRPSKALQHFEAFRKQIADELGSEPRGILRSLARKALEAAPEVLTAPIVSTSTLPRRGPVNLPFRVTPLFGRKEGIDRLAREFDADKVGCVTLVGAAGTGKTTQAVALVRGLAETGKWNVGFVAMSDHSDASRVLDAIADALQASAVSPLDPFERIRSAVVHGRNLIVLDNAEHIIDGVVPIVHRLRTEIPELRLLVTSRQALKVADECVHDVLPLGVPDGADGPLDRLAECPSVALFLDRARALRPDFALTPRNAASIVEITKRLDGLPLAIEIVASLTRVFTPSQLVERLDGRSLPLESQRRDVPARHRSLSAALDSSFEALAEEQKRFFARLSVFSGGFTIEAASYVALDNPDERGALELLIGLQDRSLVNLAPIEDDGAPSRFSLLETFREYGSERLDVDENLWVAKRHADYFASQCSIETDVLEGRKLHRFRQNVLREEGNLQLAVGRLVAWGRGVEAVRILDAMALIRPYERPTVADHETLRRIDLTNLDPICQASALRLLGLFYLERDVKESHRAFERALERAREADDPTLVVRCLAALGASASLSHDADAALKIFEEAFRLPAARKAGRDMAQLSTAASACLWSLGRLDEAVRIVERSLSLLNEASGQEVYWKNRYNLSRILLDKGSLEEGRAVAAQVLAISRRLRDDFAESMALALIARYKWKAGDTEGALETSRQVVALRRRLNLAYWLANSVRFHAYLIAESHPALAETLLVATDRLTCDRGGEVEETAFARLRIQAALSASEHGRARERGLEQSLEEASTTLL